MAGATRARGNGFARVLTLPAARAAFGLAWAVAGCGGQPSLGSTERVDRLGEPIINGHADSWPNDPAVVRIEGPNGGASGTLVSPHVILCAAHTIDGGGSFTIYFGDNQSSPVATVMSSQSVQDPNYVMDQHNDTGVIVLPSSFTAPSPATPVPMAESIPMSAIGMTARIVGFGYDTPSGGSGTKRDGTEPVTSLDSNWVVLTAGSAMQSECSGDSGGPALLDLGCGPVIIGTVNRHLDSGACQIGNYQRVDIEQSFVNAQIQMADPGFTPPGCAGADGGGGSSGSSSSSSGASSGGSASGSSSGGSGSGSSGSSSGSIASGSSSTGSSGGSSGSLGSTSSGSPSGDDGGINDFGGAVQTSAGCSCGVVGTQGSPDLLESTAATGLLALATFRIKRRRKNRPKTPRVGATF
jgi:MYXO-CTERM domain-containing protein